MSNEGTICALDKRIVWKKKIYTKNDKRDEDIAFDRSFDENVDFNKDKESRNREKKKPNDVLQRIHTVY